MLDEEGLVALCGVGREHQVGAGIGYDVGHSRAIDGGKGNAGRQVGRAQHARDVASFRRKQGQPFLAAPVRAYGADEGGLSGEPCRAHRLVRALAAVIEDHGTIPRSGDRLTGPGYALAMDVGAKTSLPKTRISLWSGMGRSPKTLSIPWIWTATPSGTSSSISWNLMPPVPRRTL